MCIICMERPNEAVIDCMHRYCSQCLDEWNEKNSTCPLCRITMTNEPEVKKEHTELSRWTYLYNSESCQKELTFMMISQLEKAMDVVFASHKARSREVKDINSGGELIIDKMRLERE